MLKIILPISLLTFLVDYAGWLSHLDGLLEPLMGLIHLPAAAALPLIVGLLTGIYGALAVMSVLPFTNDQLLLIAVFLLIAHSLVQEGLIQRQSGCPAWLATAVRLVAAVMSVWVLGWFTEPVAVQTMANVPSTLNRMLFWPAVQAWALDMARLSLKIVLIITVVMICMEILKQYHLVDRVVQALGPILLLLGLDRQVGLLWVTAAVFGITYGGAIIVEETRDRQLHPDRLKALHVSIGINHAMVEDPAVFLTLGIHPVWLWIPRLVAAMVFTHAFRLWLRVTASYRCAGMSTAPADGPLD